MSGGIEPAQRREPTVEHGNVVKDVQYCSRRLEGDPMLFEIAVNNVSAKNSVAGYLSSPKGAPEPAMVAER